MNSLLFYCLFPCKINFPELLEHGVILTLQSSLFHYIHVMFKYTTAEISWFCFLMGTFPPKFLLFLPCSIWFHSGQLLTVGSFWRGTWLVSSRAHSGWKALDPLDLPSGYLYSSLLESVKGPPLSAIPLRLTLYAFLYSLFGAFPVLTSKSPIASWGYPVT